MTMILKVDAVEPNVSILQRAAKVIKEGGVVAFPTETVYGLGADCFNVVGVLKIFKVKNRPPDNPLIVHICELQQLYELVEQDTKIAEKVIEKFWPGPVTLIFKKSAKVPKEVTGGLETIAVRMPSHPVARLLIKLSGTPIAAPSANLSGRPSPTKAEHVVEDLYGLIDVIIDAGETPLGLESSIIDFSKDRPILLRPGPATIEELKQVIPDLEVPEFLLMLEKQPSRPLSPGMTYRHYSPNKPLILVYNEEQLDEVFAKYPNSVIICPEEYSHKFKNRRILVLGRLSEPFTIAQNLYNVLRSVDNLPVSAAIVLAMEPKGILFSVMNRLKKAASEVVE
ncbi:L-threonylcarbamoyladenylate synthase [Pseudothermotoga thermarum]|uniref:Threonylcarbamoyl-AMP synthase n=1 Tax=Pseudothermotoga thermarum DSM 5069 TaxID=688269 RepID=F7YXC7_9THEM|nr:L-threonylcarbamoyladenylate synthase [Pseudothermotoga thermarum]AEH51615.1 translation factor SUA5 [Pseudothermotoga thermarum DSM 5069]